MNEKNLPTDPDSGRSDSDRLNSDRLNSEQSGDNGNPAPEPAIDPIWESVRSHDRFFKSVMQDVDRARRFLRWALSDKMLAAIDLSKLERQNESFLDASLKDSYADLLFKAPASVELPEGVKAEIPVYVFFLLEHKSYNDFKTTFQILRYIVRIWEQAEKEASEKKGRRLLPFVLPIIFHHGVTRFTAPVNLRDLICPVSGLEEFLPNWQCKLVDVETFEEDEFSDDWELRILLSVFKSIFHKGIAEKATEFFQMARPFLKDRKSKEFFKGILYYIVANARFIDPEDFEERVRKMSEINEYAPPKSWWQRECEKYEARGIAIGEARGKAEGISEGEARGEARGITEGEIKGKMELLVRILTKRFGPLPDESATKISQLTDLAEINRLADIALDIPSLDLFAENLR